MSGLWCGGDIVKGGCTYKLISIAESYENFLDGEIVKYPKECVSIHTFFGL